MEERIWYLYQNGQQMGPFDADQIKQLHANSMMTQEAYIFKVGWKDWQPLEDCGHELGIGGNAAAISAEETKQRRQNAPRATVKGRVDFHNDSQIASGMGVNISASGLFVETTKDIFQLGELVKVTVRIDSLDTFNALAKVIRFNKDAQFPVGYGLMFEQISNESKTKIQELVDEQNSEVHSLVSSM